MLRIPVFIFLVLNTMLLAKGQSFQVEIENHRAHYKEEFLKDSHSPLKEADLTYLRFFDPDSAYKVVANFVKAPKSKPFSMPTYSGIQKEYVKYGELHFRINSQDLSLSVYQSLSLRQQPMYRDYLFIPFKDATSAHETYGGGRYMDIRMGDIKEGDYTLDFNKAYNPYCAYSDGYNCPIPPKENSLLIKVMAGEKNFAKTH
jgi:hypothetical protein